VILAGTHRSFADMPLVRQALVLSGARELAGRLDPAIMANPNFSGGYGWYGILAFGLHSIQQTTDRETSLRSLARVADAGNAILIFPQGIHATREQELAGDPAARFRPGVGHLARALEAAVVPFGLAGSAALIPPSPEGIQAPVIAGIPVKITRGPLAIAFAAPLRPEPTETPQAFAIRLQQVCFELTCQAEQALERERRSRLGTAGAG
jgi:1-acyl-sn-glycerol-3-phosphate acyltransferase